MNAREAELALLIAEQKVDDRSGHHVQYDDHLTPESVGDVETYRAVRGLLESAVAYWTWTQDRRSEFLNEIALCHSEETDEIMEEIRRRRENQKETLARWNAGYSPSGVPLHHSVDVRRLGRIERTYHSDRAEYLAA